MCTIELARSTTGSIAHRQIMSVQRSPTRATCTATGAGGSQPDLSKISHLNVDTNITQRIKRRWPNDCECSKDLTEMRSEMSRISSLLEKYVGSNEQIMQKMQDSIADIKTQITDIKSTNEQTTNIIREKVDGAMTQINDIKSTTSSVLSDQKDIKTHVAKLEEAITLGETKIKSLESDFNNIKSQKTSPNLDNQFGLGEQIIQEVQNRNNREKNILLVGIPEPVSTRAEERIPKDEASVLDVMSLLITDIPKPTKVFRIGKPKLGKNRSIKVCFDAPGPAKQLLRNKGKLPDGIKMYSDQTPAQQNFLKTLKDELRRRENNGETGFTIKYINGTPAIVKEAPKN